MGGPIKFGPPYKNTMCRVGNIYTNLYYILFDEITCFTSNRDTGCIIIKLQKGDDNSNL